MFVIYTGLIFVLSFLIRAVISFKFRFSWRGWGVEVRKHVYSTPSGNLPNFKKRGGRFTHILLKARAISQGPRGEFS